MRYLKNILRYDCMVDHIDRQSVRQLAYLGNDLIIDWAA